MDLCRELAEDRSSRRVGGTPERLPAEFFLLLGKTISREDFDHWKVVGWIECLNDLVYFEDLRQQLAKEHDTRGFAEQLLAECEANLYENSYLDDLFPKRRPEPHRLKNRLARLCERLAREITLESLFLVPGLPCQWVRSQGRTEWIVEGTLEANFERVELAGTIPVGLDGAYLQAPHSFHMAGRAATPVRFVISPSALHARMGRAESRVYSVDGALRWDWRYRRPQDVLQSGPMWRRGLSLGPTLVYDRHRVPTTVRHSPGNMMMRMQRAVATIGAAWPEGLEILALLTTRVVPLRAKGVVSFSYRHRPGLSLVNVFDRSKLDLIDDLIHENSHHHLNLLLRKFVLYQGDHNHEIFYSPWRRSLRPLRGILHAAFTFTMGALLFDRLARWGNRHPKQWREAGLTTSDLLRAKFRCLEETVSVRYSLKDLGYADRQRGWITPQGRRFVRQLDAVIRTVERSATRYQTEIGKTQYVALLERHAGELQKARQTYGPMQH